MGWGVEGRMGEVCFPFLAEWAWFFFKHFVLLYIGVNQTRVYPRENGAVERKVPCVYLKGYSSWIYLLGYIHPHSLSHPVIPLFSR
jgi:hypothetical protein